MATSIDLAWSEVIMSYLLMAVPLSVHLCTF